MLKKKHNQVLTGNYYRIRITKEERRPLDDVAINSIRDAVMMLGIELAYKKAESTLAKAKRSRAKNKAEKLAAAQAEISRIEAMGKDLLGYFRVRELH
jgi:hypothetical protein